MMLKIDRVSVCAQTHLHTFNSPDGIYIVINVLSKTGKLYFMSNLMV